MDAVKVLPNSKREVLRPEFALGVLLFTRTSVV